MSGYIISNLRGMVDRFARSYGDGVERPLRLGSRGSLIVAQYDLDLAHLTAEGRIYSAAAGVVANAQATVADVPTTAAAYVLYNKASTASATPTCLLPIFVSGQQASGTPAVNTALMVSTPGALSSAPTANGTGQTVTSASGSSRSTNAWYSVAGTFSTAQSWVTVDGNNQTATAGVGSGLFADIKGFGLIRPGQAMGFTVLSAVGTNHKWGINVVFAEIECPDLG